MSIPETKLRIRFYGDPALRERSRPVREVTDNERSALKEMLELMHLGGGIGLAAPQVGIDKQMILVDIGEGPVAVINPRIMRKKGFDVMEEGCLSLPGVYVKVKRARTIRLTGLNEEGQAVSLTASGLLARVLQHEIDHLRGRMIIDYANFLQKIRFRKTLKDLKGFHKDRSAYGMSEQKEKPF